MDAAALWRLFDMIGTIAFAVSGTLVGISRRMDIFGISVLALATAVGGGMIRDQFPPVGRCCRYHLSALPMDGASSAAAPASPHGVQCVGYDRTRGVHGHGDVDGDSVCAGGQLCFADPARCDHGGRGRDDPRCTSLADACCAICGGLCGGIACGRVCILPPAPCARRRG